MMMWKSLLLTEPLRHVWMSICVPETMVQLATHCCPEMNGAPVRMKAFAAFGYVAVK
jgi:hypothetical protein